MSDAVAGDALLEIELTDLAYRGDAVGRYHGRAIFVPGGIAGERVRIRVVSESKSSARAELVEVLEASPDRVAPRYPDLAESGGFQWQHIAYPAQVAWKTHIVEQLLKRIGHFAEPLVLPTIGLPEDSDLWRYRTVAQFAIGPDGAIGFRRANSRDVLDMTDCPIVHPKLDTLYVAIREWMRARWGAEAAGFTERFTVRVAANPPDSASTDTTLNGYGLLTIETRPAGRSCAVDVIKRVVILKGPRGGASRRTHGTDPAKMRCSPRFADLAQFLASAYLVRRRPDWVRLHCPRAPLAGAGLCLPIQPTSDPPYRVRRPSTNWSYC